VHSVYDDAGRLSQEQMFASAQDQTPTRTITYTHNPRGDLTGYDDGSQSATYGVDPLGRQASAAVNYGPFTATSSYDYYPNGLVSAFTGPDHVKYGYAYDTNNQLRSVDIPGQGRITSHGYDPFQRRAWKEIGGQRTYFYL